jgi:molecular chaperone GrpE
MKKHKQKEIKKTVAGDKEKSGYLDDLQRLQAEFDNYRKRVEREKEDHSKYALEDFIGELLSVLDNFDRAINEVNNSEGAETLLEGIRLVRKQFYDCLEKQGLILIDVKDKLFDPNEQEAIGYMATSNPEEDGKVLEEIQKGYKLADRVIRAAVVRIGKFEEEKEEE